jgi:hypothetical protein
MHNGRQNGMASVFVERSGEATTHKCGAPDAETAVCLDLHRVHWQESFIAAESQRQICHFRAPDAESVRMAFRQAGVIVDTIWTGTVHDGSEPATANIVVERQFQPPLPGDAKNALDVVQSEWLKPHGFKLARAIVSFDRARIICVCEAPDGDSLPFDQGREQPAAGSVWSCRRVALDT